VERIDLGRVMQSHWLWRGQGLPLVSAGLITRATNHSSHHNSNNVPHPHRLAWAPKPSSVSLLRSNWLPRLGNRLIISNMAESMRKNSRKAANNSTVLGRYKQASLLPSVKRLLFPGQLVLTKILMRNLQALSVDWYPENPAKKAPDGHAKCH
jgi:hypothetical protein